MTTALYLYNGTRQVLDSTASLDDIRLGNRRDIPPGGQLVIQAADANAVTAIQTHHGRYGATQQTTVAASFSGKAYNSAGLLVGGKVPVTIT